MLKFTDGDWSVKSIPTQYNGIEQDDGAVWCSRSAEIICTYGNDWVTIAEAQMRVNEPGHKDKVSNAKEFRGNLALMAASPKLYKYLMILASQLSILESEDFKLSFSGELTQTIADSLSLLQTLDETE